ncbi:stage III sporulation protein AE [Clostridium septicum]|uniref:Stage III sporulation protein AE n=1 Tax=Clostridium septicum TaxID=1504 RepID=A0A9N7PKF6_CLOSE|nr:stage III sporulation protein AE [Clostridium septicum]AYE35640.1 stage III sporulation protein AE [Clostridium septicum]MDU1313237.1 stage III sporulation protein AE [Clostridium septicum]QAS61027.1 stage III sporulation protein AE [Clostridium septicum]UEC19695.1 stage III sporulation protein AE [Clostridium septicum]USS02244.1 stage III sporulation protein AE [Clostridium septicum]
MEKIKKLTGKIIIIILLGLFLSSVPSFKTVYAQSEANLNEDTINKQYDENSQGEELLKDKEVEEKLSGLYSYINNMKSDVELINELDPVEYIKNYIKSGDGNLSLKKIAQAVTSFLFKEVKVVLSLTLSIIVISIICSLLKNLQRSFSNENISNIAFFACYALLIVILSKSFLISIELAKDVIIKISDFMAALLPILVMMLGTAGGFTQAVTMDPIILGATFIIPRIYLNIIIPLILMTFVLQFANNISTEYKIDNLCKLMKQTIIVLQGFILTVFIALLTIRGITSSTIDAVTLKTAKFAVDNFIPIVGKAFSDAIATVAGYSLIIKNAVSSIGLIIIVLLMIYPIIKLALISLVYKLTAALVEPIGEKRITDSIAAAGDALILIMSTVISVSIMFFILIAIMASAGKFVIGG